MTKPYFPVFSVLSVLVILTQFSALSLGSVIYSPIELISVLLQDSSAIQQSLILDIRLPRAINAFITGGLLALSGVLMQVLLRNPLADPYILGTSGGSSFFALLMIYLGAESAWVNLAAFIGATSSILAIAVLSGGIGGWNSNRLLLTGVVLSSGWGALISFLLSISSDRSIKSMLFWLIGDLNYESIHITAGIILITGGLFAFLLAQQLNMVRTGEISAKTLGVNTTLLRITVFSLASILTATAVVTAGSIGFIGLVVPHILRFIAGSNHVWLIPASILAGGSLLTLSDTLARTVISPEQLPVGVITAFLGVPLFLFLISRNKFA